LADLPERLEFLDGPSQLLGARLEFLEQANVLDGDHRLVGEGLKQLDLLVGEGSDIAPLHGQRPDRDAEAKHRDGEHGPVPEGQAGVPRPPGPPSRVRNRASEKGSLVKPPPSGPGQPAR
jgi:hypothetical protein